MSGMDIGGLQAGAFNGWCLSPRPSLAPASEAETLRVLWLPPADP